MTQRLRTDYFVYVHHHLVHKLMCDVDTYGNEARRVNNKFKKKKQPFTSERSLQVLSLNGHDKLRGYENSTFTLAF